MGLQFRRDHSLQNRGVTFCENDNIGRRPGGAAADIRDGAAQPRRFDVQGWNDLYGDRTRRLQRSRRCAESRQGGRGRRASVHGVGVSGCCPRACVVSGCVKGCTGRRSKGRTGRKSGCDDRQYRSDGRHRQVQGRDLLEIQAPHGFLLASRRRRRVLDSVESRGRRGRHRRPFICARADAVSATHCPGALAARVHWGVRRRPASGWATARCRSTGTVRAALSYRGRRRRTP
jgi:hypothetical protein